MELGSFLHSPSSGHILRNAAKKEANSRWHAAGQLCHLPFSRRHANCCFPSEPSNHPSRVQRQSGQTEGCGAASGAHGGQTASRTRRGPALTQPPAAFACNKLKKLNTYEKQCPETATSKLRPVTSLNSKARLGNNLFLLFWARVQTKRTGGGDDDNNRPDGDNIPGSHQRTADVGAASLPAILMSGCLIRTPLCCFTPFLFSVDPNQTRLVQPMCIFVLYYTTL